MGDFNRRQETNPIRHLLGEKVYDVDPPIAMADTDPAVQKIDHVLVWPETAKVINAGVVEDRFDVGDYKQVRPSDHYPTLAVIDFQAKRPNVVIFYADDFGWGDLRAQLRYRTTSGTRRTWTGSSPRASSSRTT